MATRQKQEIKTNEQTICSMREHLRKTKKWGNKKPTNKQACSLLDDALTQLDMAVQASSVQAFEEALNIVNDSILDEASLQKAFEECPSSAAQPSIIEETIKGIQEFRIQLGQVSSSSNSKDAMAAMKNGTSARVAMDTHLAGISTN